MNGLPSRDGCRHLTGIPLRMFATDIESRSVVVVLHDRRESEKEGGEVTLGWTVG